jgi:uncharacterized protein YndB with AHSA1/START domain
MTIDIGTRSFSTLIAASQEVIWNAITRDTAPWYFGNTIESSWEVGEPVTYRGPGGDPHIHGTLLALDAPNRVAMTFRPIWTEQMLAAGETQTEWVLEPDGEHTRVTLTQRGLAPDNPAADDLADGWTHLLATLKTLLER